MAENWGNGLSDEGRCPEPGYRMAAEGTPFPSRWTSGTISTNLEVIWGMSVQLLATTNAARRTARYPSADHRKTILVGVTKQLYPLSWRILFFGK